MTTNTNEAPQMTSEQELQKAPQTPEEIELHWYKTVYQGDSVAQLTFRAVLMGMALGCIMSLSNLYIGLKTGWGLGVAITACILSFSIYRTLMKVFPRIFRTDMTILENNCMQSTASAAGYSSGSTMVSAVAAYLLITGHHMPWPVLLSSTFFLAALGVFIAIPMKRQMINIEQLRFPSGIACAETLKSLHAEGAGAVKKARSLGLGGLVGAAVAWFRDAGKPFAIPSMLEFPGSIGGFALSKWTINFDMSAVMIAAGAIMGWKTAWSMLLGAILNYAVLAPWMAQLGAIETSNLGYRAIMSWSTWAGASIMVSSGLFSFCLQWKTIANSLKRLRASVMNRLAHHERNPMDDIEVPVSWFLIGTLVSGIGSIAVLYFAFGTSVWIGLLAVLLSFLLSVVACRVTGETDTTPVGAMGKITQLTFGIIAPTNIITNLMTANVTASAAGSSADLLTDLKSGYLLGANPRKQFLAQFFGIFAGTAIVVPAFYLLVPDAASLGTDRWPAPAAQIWAAVARLLASGFEALHPAARMGLFIGLATGIVLPTLELLFPKAKKYIPSATGLGLAMVIPFFNSFSMFIGALIALVMEKKFPKQAEEYIIPVSSGVIAGESLLGIVIALLQAQGWL